MLENLVNGKVYVGQTIRRFHLRLNLHRQEAKRGTRPLHKAIRKYGWASFATHIVCSAKTQAQLHNLERVWILLMRSTDRNHGYNLTFGGEGGARTAEACERIGRAHIGQRPWNKGEVTWKELRARSRARLGSPELSEKFRQIALKRKPMPEHVRLKISETLKRKGCAPPWKLVDRSSERMSKLGRKGALSRWGG